MVTNFADMQKCAEESSCDLAMAQERLTVQDVELIAAAECVSVMEEKLQVAEVDRGQILTEYDKEVARRTKLEEQIEREVERFQQAHLELLEERDHDRAEVEKVLTARFNWLGWKIEDLNNAQEPISMWGQVVGVSDIANQMLYAGVAVPKWLVTKVAKDKEEWERKIEDLLITDLLQSDLDVKSLWPRTSTSAEGPALLENAPEPTNGVNVGEEVRTATGGAEE